MAQEETREQQQIYNVFRLLIYAFLLIELVVNLPIVTHDRLSGFVIELFHRLKFFDSVITCKVMEVVCVCLTSIGTKARKSLKFDVKKMVIYPFFIGFCLLVSSVVLYKGSYWGSALGFSGNRILYAIASVIGIVLLHFALDAISKYFNNKMGKDRFNFENESFKQSEKLVNTPYSVNIPMIYYHQGRMHDGWINIVNPFRGTLVLGTPGSGKSFGIIDPFIRQHSAKGFAMMVYDFKFPTLCKTLMYQYFKNKKYGRLPENCGFHIINFADVRYSNRINPIQKKYIPDLAAASETAATLLESLNKGGGDKKGGSEAFFQNASENFLAAIIYFFVNFHPTGYKHGKKLERHAHYIIIEDVEKKDKDGNKIKVKEKTKEGNLKIIITIWNDYTGINEKGEKVLNFTNKDHKSASLDENGLLKELKGLTYTDHNGRDITITDAWYEDGKGNRVEPDTITGEFSDMAHVLQFLNKSYDDVFYILMQDPNIKPLMAPFESAYKNNAMDQLEGMVGTLRVSAGRLATPEAYWIFTGDDFDLKISDKEHSSYLVIANSPEKEQIVGSLNALILNRLVTRINSKGNLPCSLIVDELPTLYFHKIDRLIGTARSNKVSVTLGYQENPQLEADYGKNGKDKILSTCGNIFMGAARNKDTLEWAQNDVFGKVKQTSHSISINDSKVSTSISEKLDNLVPAAKIADMATGWLAGQAARDFSPTPNSAWSNFDIENSPEFQTTKYFCKTNFNMKKIKDEESHYMEVPPIYDFGTDRDKEITLIKCFNQVDRDIENMIQDLNPKA